eukprot:3433791-Amphidinium_carterae.1
MLLQLTMLRRGHISPTFRWCCAARSWWVRKSPPIRFGIFQTCSVRATVSGACGSIRSSSFWSLNSEFDDGNTECIWAPLPFARPLLVQAVASA